MWAKQSYSFIRVNICNIRKALSFSCQWKVFQYPFIHNIFIEHLVFATVTEEKVSSCPSNRLLKIMLNSGFPISNSCTFKTLEVKCFMEFLVVHFFLKNDHIHFGWTICVWLNYFFLNKHRNQGIKWVGETFIRLYSYQMMWPWQIYVIFLNLSILIYL